MLLPALFHTQISGLRQVAQRVHSNKEGEMEKNAYFEGLGPLGPHSIEQAQKYCSRTAKTNT